MDYNKLRKDIDFILEKINADKSKEHNTEYRALLKNYSVNPFENVLNPFGLKRNANAFSNIEDIKTKMF